MQFEPDALRTLMERIPAHEPQGMLLTHYKRVDRSTAEVQALAGTAQE